jgi:hypothetical protein
MTDQTQQAAATLTGAASALDDGLAVITHGGSDRGYKLCRCCDCGEESICTPDNDFYTTANDDNGPLKCERCFAKYAHALRAANRY